MTYERNLLHWQQVVLQFPCEACGAAPGAQCITIGGKEKHEPHALRSRRASEEEWRLLDE